MTDDIINTLTAFHYSFLVLEKLAQLNESEIPVKKVVSEFAQERNHIALPNLSKLCYHVHFTKESTRFI